MPVAVGKVVGCLPPSIDHRMLAVGPVTSNQVCSNGCATTAVSEKRLAMPVHCRA